MTSEIFNRQKKQQQLDRASKNFFESSFLFDEVADRINFQISDLLNVNFNNTLIIGDRNGITATKLSFNPKIKNIIHTSSSYKMLSGSNSLTPKVQISEELLPFKENSFDLIVANLSLHWVNDLVGALIQIRNSLKKGGFFTATLFGSKTLMQLRQALLAADEKYNNASPRISPFLDVRDGASLIQRAKFNEPVSIAEEITVKYESLSDLFFDLKNMGETSCLIKSNKKVPPRNLFVEAESFYIQHHSDEQKNLVTTFEVVTMSGWKL